TMYFEPRDPASDMPMITIDLATPPSKESTDTQNKDGEDKGIVFAANESGSPSQRVQRFLSDPGPDHESDDHLQS
ncbi:hypothetical protein scyTo_0022372, partial [Scyliorhinus torazame]|nr:hypothetical protein [Scyliorhinus torazame]